MSGRFTDEERARVREGVRRGESWREIAAALGRDEHTIRKQAHRLGIAGPRSLPREARPPRPRPYEVIESIESQHAQFKSDDEKFQERMRANPTG